MPARARSLLLLFAVLYFLHSLAVVGERFPDLRHFQQLLAVIFFLYTARQRTAFGSMLPVLNCLPHPQVGPPARPPSRGNNLNF